MTARPTLRWALFTAGLLLAGCGGGAGSQSSAATSSTADATSNTTVPAIGAVTTSTSAPATSTAPPTTLPPILDLDTLPGLLAVVATSCAPEPYPPHDIIEDNIVCTLKPNGTDVKVVSLPGESPSGIVLTRDGTHLHYGDPFTRFGYVIDLNTGEHRERQRGDSLRSGVSPDLQWIGFIDGIVGVAISKIDVSAFPDGSLSQSVAADPHIYSGPSWAPDSVRFAYLSTNDGNGGDLECPEVWVGAIDGTPPVQITHFASNADGAEGCPESARWSPTDDRILLHLLGQPAYVAENLYAIDPDGSNLTALTHGVPNLDPNASTYASAGSSYAGDWSPDGKYIVFIVGDGTDYQLAVMNADGSQITPITEAPLGIASSLASIRWSLG